MRRFKKKSIVIEAIQYTGSNEQLIIDFVGRTLDKGEYESNYPNDFKLRPYLVIPTLEDGKNGQAKHIAEPGDWIIKGIQNEFYPIKNSIFLATYESAE